MDLDKAIKERHSVRKFKSKKPDWRTIIECIDTARYAPMAGGDFTPKFILVDDKEKIQAIADATQQSFVGTAQYIVVMCTNPSRTADRYDKRGEIYCKQQAGAAAQNFVLKITEAGLGTCWVGHLDEEEIKRALRIPENINVDAVFPIGYEFSKPRTRRAKADLDSFLYFNEYKNKKMRKPKKITSA